MFQIEEVTREAVTCSCDPSYNDLAICDPDSGYCQPDCPPCGPSDDCNPDCSPSE